MKNKKQNTILLLLLGFFFLQSFYLRDILFVTPDGWPQPVYNFENNPLSAEKIELGRHLFYDPVLSIDSSTSCANCHLQYTAFTHVDHDLSHGVFNRIGTRNSPALTNLAWSPSFMWDGSINHLDMQALAPIEAHSEMGHDFTKLITQLQQSKKYPKLFEQAFGTQEITGEHFLKALSQFQLTLISANAKYDKVMRQEEGITFTEQEERGYRLFKANCESCHREPLFTTFEFKNNGLPIDTTLYDYGRGMITKQAQDSLTFKIPSLRNVEFSHPYMHDGRFRKLSQVINHYTSGIHQSKTLALELKDGIDLNEMEKVDLVAFLLTLTDKEFLFNPKHSFPRE